MKNDKLELQGKAILSLMRKASAGIGEDNDGGNLTYLELLRDILSANYLEGTLYDKAWKVTVSEKAHGILLPLVDQSARSTGGGILGGIITYEIEEGVDITLTFPKFAQTSLPLNQVGVAARVTNALVQDSTVLPQFLRKGFQDAIKMKLDRSILYGDGASTCYGVIGGTAIGERATLRLTLSNPYTVSDLRSMLNGYYGGNNGCWVMAKDAWDEIIDLYSDATNPVLPLEFSTDVNTPERGFLYGFPVYVLDCMDSRDMVLGDFSAYVVDQKSLREDISEHLYFSSSEQCFRSIIRFNGAPIWTSPIAQQNAGTYYCYVASVHSELNSSSSSSSSLSSESSSSYVQNHSTSSNSSSSESDGNVSTSSDSSKSSASSNSLSSNSLSSASSASSNSSSSSSENNSESSSKSSESSSSYNVLGCLTKYCASTFVTGAHDGSYVWDEVTTHGGKAVYDNGSFYIWFDTVTGYWVLSNDVGDPQNQWLSSKDTAGGCPDGTWAGESGSIAEGAC